MEDLIGAFLSHQRGRNFSPKTIRRRKSSLHRFALHVAPLAIGAVTPELVEDFVHRFRSPATRHAYRADIVAFYAWALKRGLATRNPGAETDSIRSPKTLPRPISARELDYILAMAVNPDLRLWLALAAYAGLRVSEIANLCREDVTTHGTAPVLIVRGGKGGKDRAVPLHPSLGKLIATVRRAGPLFTADADTIGRMGSTHMRGCGIDATMHMLRHTFGTEAARMSGGNIVLVGHLMGHSSPETTMGYIGWAGGESAAVVASMYSEIATI